MAALLVPAAAQAQYFGRNQVRYRTFDFQVMKTEHFDIYYYPEEKEAIERAAPMAERWYARLRRLLGHSFSSRQPVILYGSHPEFEQTNVIGGAPGESTGGVTEAIKRRVVLPFAGPLAETDHVLGHELVHAFQFDMTGQDGSGGAIPGALRLPLWFIEGMAEYLSVGPVDPHTAMWMRDAAKREKLPKISQLNSSKYFPYRYGQAFWAYVGGRFGDHVIGDVLKIAGKRGDAEKALEEVLGVKSDDLSKDWHKALQDAYQPLMASKKSPADYGRALITEEHGGGELNIAPKLSPDGKQIVFLSERGLFAVEMYLADAQTGKVKKTIVKTAVDPHFESLQFINSAGAWDASGRRFVFGAITAGRPVLSILDVARGNVEREVPLHDLGEIHSPTWSPDGRYVAFSAITGGLTDLYIYDLQAGSLRQLTQDAFADLQPAWSPDGRSIAFVTDRFSTAVELTEGRAYRLAVLDPASGAIKELPSFEEGKNIDPQWAADSQSLYFLSDRNGITNVYRLEIGSGRQFQVTDLLTGVSGITALSPALSVAGSRMAFGAYEDGNYSIYTVDEPRTLAGTAVEGTVDRNVAAMLPPRDRRAAEVMSLRGDPAFGLPRQKTFASGPYKSKLQLDYVGQPSVSVGSDPFGTYVGGGVSMFFSDMLGNHSVGAILQVNGGFEDFGGIVGYVNRKHRWDWGVGIEQIPYLTGSFAQGTDSINGEPAFVEQQVLFRQTNRAVNGFVAYPFSRSRRIELGASFRNISFKQTVETQAFSLRTGQILINEKQDLPAPDALNLGEGTAALVGDTSLFGATSPILGQRYRLEVSPTIGDLKYTGVLADYRRYVMPVRPYTFALRLLHYGRYGSGGGDERLQPLFIGYPNLVRGYDVNSFGAAECVSSKDSSCPVFDQLLGTRVAVANLELRFPPFGALGGKGLYGPIPIELLGFADVGVAWRKGDSVKLDLSGADGSLTSRRPVRSLGVGARVNVFGYAILEVDYVKPLDRPAKNWVWLFNLSPGF
jgi:Tol biopolymer transport system component